MRDDATKKGKQVEDKEKETEAKTADAEAEKTCESSQSDEADKDETAKEEPAGTAEQDEEPGGYGTEVLQTVRITRGSMRGLGCVIGA